MNILDLPNVMLTDIFEYLSYDEVAKIRLVCRQFDHIAQDVLCRGFQKAVKQHSVCLKRIKALLPRRESERRNHCLARHADILTSIETRLSMLSMTYSKYIDLKMCCFIPGRVLDEIFKILRLITKSKKPLRPHEVLQELRDISSMAIEHFDEKIARNLKTSFCETPSTSSARNVMDSFARMPGCFTFSGSNIASASVFGSTYIHPLSKHLGLIETSLGVKTEKGPQSSFASIPATTSTHQQDVKNCSGTIPSTTNLRKVANLYNTTAPKLHKLHHVQNVQQGQIQENSKSVAELSAQILELKKRLEDVEAKNRELNAKIDHIIGSDSTNADNINNIIVNSNNDNRPCTSSETITIDKNVNKRRIDDEERFALDQADDIKKPEDIPEVEVKKSKMTF